MDLGTITTRLDGAAYTIDAFAADVRLVFSNADAYCTSRYPMIANAAAALSKKFETALKKKLINADVRTGKTDRCAAKKAPSPDEPVYTSDVDFAIAPPGPRAAAPERHRLTARDALRPRPARGWHASLTKGRPATTSRSPTRQTPQPRRC